MQLTKYAISGGILQILGFYLLTQIEFGNPKRVITIETRTNDFLFTIFGLAFIYFGYCLISSLIIAICILWVTAAIYCYLKHILNYNL